jgi:hypothetical protein
MLYRAEKYMFLWRSAILRFKNQRFSAPVGCLAFKITYYKDFSV